MTRRTSGISHLVGSPTSFAGVTENLRAHFRLTGSTVLSLGCTTGSDEMADAFLAAGAKAFAGPSGYPDASDAIVFTHLLFHGLAQGAEIEAAAERARDFAPTLTEWRLWAL